jgi:Abi-like protein
VDKWVKQWLSEPRLLRYLSAANGDKTLCLELYVWNNWLAAALLRDLADLEVLIRNKFNNAIVGRQHRRPHWLLDPESSVRVAKLHKLQSGPRRGETVDRNAVTRSKIERAIKDAGAANATPGQVVAQLTFGFWLSLVRRNREHEIWTPYVVHAFSPRQDRQEVETHMEGLNDLRNRVAHHEHLLTTDVPKYHASLLELCGWLSPRVATHIAATSNVAEVLAERPC